MRNKFLSSDEIECSTMNEKEIYWKQKQMGANGLSGKRKSFYDAR